MNDNEIVQILQKANEAIETLQGAYEVMSALADVRKEEIESLQAQLAEKDAEIKRLNDESPAYKFYYCESEDSYLLGYRVGNFYYAHWHEGVGFVWDMSRYLPWGETIDGRERGCAWGVHTYPSKPIEMGTNEWFNGFLAQRLAASQRRERAAVEDLKLIVDAVREAHCDETCCFACKFDCDTSITDSGCYANECPGFERDDCFEWRGTSEEGEDGKNA